MFFENLIRKYNIHLINKTTFRINGKPSEEEIEEIRFHKPEIISFLKDKIREEENEYSLKKKGVRGIEGRGEVKEAIKKWDEYQYLYSRWKTSPEILKKPSKPTVSLEEVREKYPYAASYFDVFFIISTDENISATIGKKALNVFATGKNPEIALKMIEK